MPNVAIVSRETDDTVQRQITEAGYRAHRVDDLRGLLELLGDKHIDVVLLHPSARDDSTMPDMVRSVTHSPGGDRTAVLPLLQRGELADRVRSFWYGAANILDLPLREGELLAGVASVLRRQHTLNLPDNAVVV